jgi:hypothetical protein
MFVAGMYSAAFFETDVERIVEDGLRSIPEKSGYARIVRTVLDLWRRYPVGVIDAYAPARTTDMGLWHTDGLPDRNHVLRDPG